VLLPKKVVIVTGAGGGLGAGIARVCHREGARVVVADIRADAARSVARRLRARALPVVCDVTKDQDLERLVEETLARFGRVDGLVNNAGVNFAKPFLSTTPEDWTRVISVDLRAVFFLSQLVARRMIRQRPRGGSIVNISSVHASAVLPGSGPYDAAKWGVIGMGKSIAVELATKGVRVNSVSPGLLDTQIWQDILAAAPSRRACLAHWKANIPVGRVIDPEEIGALVAFLLSDRCPSITGANILHDGGMTSQLVSREPYQSAAIEGRKRSRPGATAR
jgi:NAD(P)-dependent dehydrogenase (short-subunit alcohol dehydrogenase family)